MTQSPTPDNLHSESHLFPAVEESAEITIACTAADYSASRIARAIEDCDANLINLNVTSNLTDDGRMTVLIRAALRNPDSAVRALERYGYPTIAVHSPSQVDANSLRDRVDQLLNQLNL